MFNKKTLDLTSLMIVVAFGFNAGITVIFGFDVFLLFLGGYNSVFTKTFYIAVALSSARVFYSYLMTPGRDLPKV